MNADNKIKEAEFFLQKIVENYNEFPFIEYYFQAFITSTRSVPEYLLEDYNIKYDLKILNDERNFKKKFEEIAKTFGHAKCKQCGFFDDKSLQFYKWYEKQIIKIKSNSIGSELWDKRNLIIHRRGEKLDDFSQKMAHAMKKEIPKGMAMRVQSTDGEPDRFLPTTVIKTERLAYVDLKSACEEFLSLMKEMVLESHKQFP